MAAEEEKRRDAETACAEEMEQCLAAQRKRYPLMNEEDVVKFAFQGMLGVGHLIRSEEDAARRLKAEMDELEADGEEPYIEKISTEWVRMNLRAAKARGVSSGDIADMLCRSARCKPFSFTRKDVYSFCVKQDGSEKMKQAAAKVLDENWLPSHSRGYRDAYHPAYRVLHILIPLCFRRRIMNNGISDSGKTDGQKKIGFFQRLGLQEKTGSNDDAVENRPESVLSRFSISEYHNRVAVTRNGYAILNDGTVSFSDNCVKDDTAHFRQYSDFIDIQGGFDFVIGLRSNGEVISTRKQTGKTERNLFAWYGNNCFPDSDRFPLHTGQIAAAEGHVAAVSLTGRLYHQQNHGFEQHQIETEINDRVKAVAVGYDTLVYIDSENQLYLLPDDEEWSSNIETVNQRIREKGEIPVHCKMYANCYCSPAVAVLTDQQHLIWCCDISAENCAILEFPYLVKQFAVGSFIAAGIDPDGKVFVQRYQGDVREIASDDPAVDVGIIHNDKLIILHRDGKADEIDLES